MESNYGLFLSGFGSSAAQDPWVFQSNVVSSASRLPELAPPMSLAENDLTPVPLNSSHGVVKMRIESENWRFVDFRKCDTTYHPIHVQIEAATCASYRITQCYVVPRMRPVVDASGKVIGSASYGESPWLLSSTEASSCAVSEMMRKGIDEEPAPRLVGLGDDLHTDPLNNFAFLKEVLIDFETHMKIMKPYFAVTQEGQEVFQRLKNNVEARWNELEEHLVSSKAFRNYIVQERTIFRKTAFEECRELFKKYNRQFAHEGIGFDLEGLKEKYYKIVKKCIVKDAIMAIYDLGSQLKPHCIDTTYEQPIAIFEAFERSHDPLWPLFCELKRQLVEYNHFQAIVDNYRDIIFFECQLVLPSVKLEPMQSRATAYVMSGLYRESYLANAVKEFLADVKCKPRVVSILENCLERYRPIGQGGVLEYVNPMAYCRVRTDEITTLLEEVRLARPEDIAIKIVDFLGK